MLKLSIFVGIEFFNKDVLDGLCFRNNYLTSFSGFLLLLRKPFSVFEIELQFVAAMPDILRLKKQIRGGEKIIE